MVHIFELQLVNSLTRENRPNETAENWGDLLQRITRCSYGKWQTTTQSGQTLIDNVQAALYQRPYMHQSTQIVNAPVTWRTSVATFLIEITIASYCMTSN